MTITENDITKGEYIDLGLPSGLKWASCNLGATSPCEYGDYYMWGSVTPNTDDVCSWATAPFNGGASDYDADYFNAHKSEWLDGDILNPEYDAAYQATGGKAHMPTEADFQELIDNTINQWCNYNNINGRLFTSKTNGNSIFIPADSYRYGVSFGDRGSRAYVWSSSCYAPYFGYAFRLGFDSDSCYVRNSLHIFGFAVRPVSK